MDPGTLTDQINRRQALLRGRALDRAQQLCIENMNSENFDKAAYIPHLQKQSEVISQREPHILDSDANFIFRVLKERCLIAMEQDRLRQTQAVQQQANDQAHSFTAEQHQRFEIDQRYGRCIKHLSTPTTIEVASWPLALCVVCVLLPS